MGYESKILVGEVLPRMERLDGDDVERSFFRAEASYDVSKGLSRSPHFEVLHGDRLWGFDPAVPIYTYLDGDGDTMVTHDCYGDSLVAVPLGAALEVLASMDRSVSPRLVTAFRFLYLFVGTTPGYFGGEPVVVHYGH